MYSRLTIGLLVLMVMVCMAAAQECDCNYNAHCRGNGANIWCTSKNTCSGNCVGAGPWAYCRPNPYRCDQSGSTPGGAPHTSPLSWGNSWGNNGGWGGNRWGGGSWGGWGKKK